MNITNGQWITVLSHLSLCEHFIYLVCRDAVRVPGLIMIGQGEQLLGSSVSPSLITVLAILARGTHTLPLWVAEFCRV